MTDKPQMTKSHKQLLEPFAIVLAGMDAKLRDMTTEELIELRKACEAVTPTNCWCFTFHAANVIRPEIDRLLRCEKAPA